MKSGASILLSVLFWLAPVVSGSSVRQEADDPGSAESASVRAASPQPAEHAPAAVAPGTDVAAPECSVTEHTVHVNGNPIRYRATAGYLPIEGGPEKPLASVFFVAYEQEDEGQASAEAGRRTASRAVSNPPSRSRPIAFVFNGGPGASSVWLHMGALGPKRALLAEDGTALPPSKELVDNDYTWLEFTDLVFVDPVGTGFSRAAPGVSVNQFYEVQKDVEIAADFVRLFVTRNERWLSPQFLVGESYGAARAVGMAKHLQDRYGLYVGGLILLSSALDLGTISFDPGNDLPYVLSLPSYTAVAWYHDKLRDRPSFDMERLLQRVQTWALEDYIAALTKGGSLTAAEFRETARRLAEYTGLHEDVIVQKRLRVSNAGFARELLDRESRVLGLLDGRVTAPDLLFARDTWTDPSLFVVQGPFVATFNSYVRVQLGFQTDRAYIFLSDRVNALWDWGPGRSGYLNVAPTLAEAMGLDRRLRVFAAAGYYDLATPYLSQEYVLNHLDLPAGLRRNIVFRRYHAGHQIYTSPEALRQLTADVKAFVSGRETP